MVGFSGVDVQGAAGQQFGVKLLAEQPWKGSSARPAEPNAYSIDQLRPGADAMRALRASFELLAGRQGCRRAIMCVEAAALLDLDERFVDSLCSIPKTFRERLVIEVDVRGVEITCELAEMARVLQEECSATLAVLTDCESIERIEELVGALDPGILSLDSASIAESVRSGSRIALLDAMEVGAQAGALVMANGVDSQEALAAMQGLGIDMLCGRGVSNVRSLVSGDFKADVHIMARYDRRERAATAA